MNHLPVAMVSSATAVLLIAALAGCAPATSGSVAGGTTAPSAGPSAAAKPAAVGSSDGACKYLSIADLNSLTGRSYATSTNKPLSDPINYSYCSFKTTGKAEFDLLVSTSDPADVMGVENEADGNKLVPKSGIGDSALIGSNELVVQYGQDVIEAGDLTFDPGMKPATLDQLKAIIAKTHSHM
jgi:Protein of unknown function (DUF3558)